MSHPLGIWSAGVLIGLRTLRKEPVLGLKRLALPVSYWRSREFAYAWRQLPRRPGARVLDLGSPKDLAVMLARHRGYAVVATDILPDAIALSRRYASAQGLDTQEPAPGGEAGRVLSEVQDGRALTYPDSSFDAAYSVSVLEHIPGRGDVAAIRELVRVVKPGGVVVVTVPFDRTYRETFVQGPVYERTPVATEPIFFERHYDESALVERLLGSPCAEVVDLSYWGEGIVRTEALLNRLGPVALPLSPLQAFFATLSLRPVGPNGNGRGGGGSGHPMAAFLTLRRR